MGEDAQDEDDTKVEHVVRDVPKCPLCRHSLRLNATCTITPEGEEHYVEAWECVKCDYSEVVEVISELTF